MGSKRYPFKGTYEGMKWFLRAVGGVMAFTPAGWDYYPGAAYASIDAKK